jgi:hypothetical protein
MAYTLGEAAKATGKSKTTIKRALEKGVLFSVKKSDLGEWQIEPIELHRIYPRVDHGTVTLDTPGSTPGHTELQVKLHAAEREMTLLRELLDREREVSRGLEQDRDQWRQQATALLTDQRRPQAAIERRSFWARLLGGGRA